jgi:hypothetical protein
VAALPEPVLIGEAVDASALPRGAATAQFLSVELVADRLVTRRPESLRAPCARRSPRSLGVRHRLYGSQMTPEMSDRLKPFREEALVRNIPSADVERWTETARPCATLAPEGDGPVVGRFGGPLMLPVDAPEPRFPFVGSIDCAALPEDATDLPLPADGHLLLFGYPDIESFASMGEVIHVPAGTAVEERERVPHSYTEIPEYRDICQAFPQGQLRLTTNVSLPYHCWTEIPEPPWATPLPGHPRSEELRDVWLDMHGDITTGGPLQIGGYASEECPEVDPVVGVAYFAAEAERAGERAGSEVELNAPEDWVLLADWHPGITGREGATLHWAIRREDLAARRFDQAHVTVFWNP